jgi:photosystem II stability/assembly factor-like uncharacterized protein
MTERIRPPHLLFLCCALALLFTFTVKVSAEEGGDIEYAEIQPLAVESLLLDVVRIGDRLVAAGERGHIIYSDNGQDWVQADVVPTRSTINKLFVQDDRLWAAGHDSVILTSGDRGKTWTRRYFAPERMQPIMDIYFSDANHGLALGAYSLMLFTVDGGQTWQDRKINDEDDFHLNALFTDADGRYLIAGEAGYSYLSFDQGQNWQSMDMPYQGSMFGAVETESACVLFYGLRGHIQKSCDFGDSWIELETGSETTISDAVSYQGKILMVGNSGVVLEVNGDSGFSEYRHSSGVDFAAVIHLGEGRFLLVGEEGVHHYPETVAEDTEDDY